MSRNRSPVKWRGLVSAAAAAFAAVFFVPPAADCGAAAPRPVPDVALVEDHSEALCLWNRAGVKGATVVHVDAHPDLHSPTVRIGAPGSAVARALDRHSCAELALRTGFVVRSDALYGIGDFLAAAHRAGIVSRVIWVPAVRGAPGREGYLSFLASAAGHLPAGLLDGLAFDGRRMSGRWDGLELSVVTLDRMGPVDGPVVLDVDVDFFSRLAGDAQEELPGVVEWFFHRLEELELDVSYATVSLSTRGGYAPLEHRRLARVLAEALPGPVSHAPGLSAPPGSAASFYGAALTAARDGRDAEALSSLRKAVTGDPGFTGGYADLAGVLLRTVGRDGAVRFLDEGVAGHPGDLPLVLAAGGLYLEWGEWERAEKAFRGGLAQDGEVPAFHAGLAFALRGMGREADAGKAMERFRRTAHPGDYREAVLKRWGRAD